MKVTLSVIKADVGSIGGHTRPPALMPGAVRARVGDAIRRTLLIDALMPAAINTAVAGAYCLPLVSCLAFSMDPAGRFTPEHGDVFGDVTWNATRLKVQQKADEWRWQGFVGPTMASHAELAYTGIVDTLAVLDREFVLRREESAPAARA
jgi:fructose 1,6-bisphosphatase